MSIWRGKYGPLLIAEIGGNHEGDFDYALRLTELAIESNVDYIKYQIYTGDTLVNPVENPTRHKHFKKFELSEEKYRQLAHMCQDAGIGFMASVWHPEFTTWVDDFSSIYKIGSGDFTAYPVLASFVQMGKPLLLSTGLSNLEEVIRTVQYVQGLDEKYKDPEMLAVLQCTSMYPIPFSAANLSTMQVMKEQLNLPIGYSDHTEGSYALEIAVAMGAEILEFHFTDSREGKTFRDHKVSLTRDEVWDLQKKIQQIKDLQGDGKKVCLPEEEVHLISFRRGLYLNKDMQTGSEVTKDDIVSLRPNHGIDARDYDRLIGKTLTTDIKQFEKLDWQNFK